VQAVAAGMLAVVIAAGGAGKPSGVQIYAVGDRTAPRLTSADIVRSSVTAASNAGHAVLAFGFTKAGALKFHRLTLALARRGARLHRLERFAFAVDGHVYSRPYIDYRDNPAGLQGPLVEIQLGRLSTARKLAALMRAH
jgi:preprotein translocase subunit SecD